MGEYKADDRFGWLGNGLPFNIAPRKNSTISTNLLVNHHLAFRAKLDFW